MDNGRQGFLSPRCCLCMSCLNRNWKSQRSSVFNYVLKKKGGNGNIFPAIVLCFCLKNGWLDWSKWLPFIGFISWRYRLNWGCWQDHRTVLNRSHHTPSSNSTIVCSTFNNFWSATKTFKLSRLKQCKMRLRREQSQAHRTETESTVKSSVCV